MGLEERMSFLPNQLSGGQCQRVAIARAIVGRPKVLLADEPTGALDTASGRQIMELFEELHRNGSTIIMITHDRNVAENAGKIWYIRDGVLSENETISSEIQEYGNPAEMQKEKLADGTYEQTAGEENRQEEQAGGDTDE